MRLATLALAASLLLALPCASFASVSFGRVTQLYAQPCWPERLEAALESRPWIDGTTFNGWGIDRTDLFYEGGATDFATFLTLLQQLEVTHVGSDGKICPVKISLTLAPGRGRLAKRTAELHQLAKPFDYDWSVAVTVMYDDQAGRAAPFVTDVADSQGRTLKRRIAREPVLTPNLRIDVVWHVGDGSALSQVELPSAWLFSDTSRGKSSLYLKRPTAADVDAGADKTLFIASERIERFLAVEAHKRQQAQAAWRIAEFYGVTIDLAYEPDAAPTVLATYDGSSSPFDVRTAKRTGDGESFPPTATNLVERWLDARRAEVLRQWDAAQKSEPVEMLDPLE